MRVRIFKNADYILDIGQGDSFADIYGKGRFLWIDQIHKLARLYNKPYCLLPQTIGPFENKKIKEKAIESINKADLCMARDKQSLDYVVQNVPQQKNELSLYQYFHFQSLLMHLLVPIPSLHRHCINR